MNKKRQRAIELIKKIYSIHSAGGAFYVVLDDGNTEDYFIQYSLDNLEEFSEPENIEIYKELGALLLQFTERQRDNIICAAFKEDA